MTFGEWRREYGRPPLAPPILAWQWWLVPGLLGALAVASGLTSLDSAIWSVGLFCGVGVVLEGEWMRRYLTRHLGMMLGTFSVFCERYAADLERGVPDLDAFDRAIASERNQRGPVALMMRSYFADYADFCAVASRTERLNGRPLVVETLLADFTRADESSPTPTAEQVAALHYMAERTAQGEWQFLLPDSGPSRGGAKMAARARFGIQFRVALLTAGVLAAFTPIFRAYLGLHGWPLLAFVLLAGTSFAVLGHLGANEPAKRDTDTPPADAT